MQRLGGALVRAERRDDMRPLDMADTEHLKEIRELIRSLLAPRPLEEELSGVQDRGLGSRRKPLHHARHPSRSL